MHVKDFVVHVCESSVGYGNTRIYNVEGGQKEQYTHSHTLIQSTQTLLLSWPWLCKALIDYHHCAPQPAPPMPD